MNLFYFSNSRIPTEKAHGYQIMKMCEVLAENGVKLNLVLPSRKNQDFTGVDLFNHYHVKKIFTVKKIKSFDPIHFVKPSQSKYIRIQSLFFGFGLFWHLLLNGKKKADIFYTRDEFLLPLLQLFSEKVVWEAHSLPRNQKYYLKFWRRCFKIVTISQYIKDELIALGLTNDKILVAPDAIDLDLFSKIDESKNDLRKTVGLPLDKKLVLYTGHLYGWKGAQVLADSAAYLPEYLFVFIGGTKFDIENFKKKNQGKTNILILPHRPHHQIPRFINSADILAIPNLGDKKISKYYTSPLKLFEYLSTNRPIIASDLPSLKAGAGEFKGVYYFRAGDAQDLASQIKKIDINLEYQRDLTNYTWQKRAAKILTFIA